MAKQPQKPTKAPSQVEQDAAYAQVKQTIQNASETGVVALDLSGKGFQNLITLPEQIKDLGQLTHLNLSGTRVSDINDLCDSIGLKQLDLSDTRVSDLLPLLPLTQLGKILLVMALTLITMLRQKLIYALQGLRIVRIVRPRCLNI